jgi:uncharacterized membrane protein
MFRNSKHMGWRLAISLAVGLLCCSAALAAKPPKPVTPAYTIMPFMVTPPAEYQSDASFVYDLNELGHAVGSERFRKNFEDGSHEELGWGLHLNTATGDCTRVPNARWAMGINNLNQIVGETANGGAFWRGPADNAPVSLPPLSGDTASIPCAINDAGMVAGNSLYEAVSSRGALWRVAVDENDNVSVEEPVPLPLLEDAPQAWARGLSEMSGGSFQVTGYAVREDDSLEAVVWTVTVDDDGTLRPGPAISLVTNHAYSYGYGVNIDGDVCGHLERMPFVAFAEQTAQTLPVPRYTTWGVARSINNLGDIVGQLEIYPKGAWSGIMSGKAGYFAYLWKNGTPIDLTTQIDPNAGWARLWQAAVINDGGMIGGSGPRDIQWRGFVLIPKPQ